MSKLTVGILTSEHGRFGRFWQNLRLLDVPPATVFATEMSLNIAFARNKIIRESSSEYVWFVDDDHTFQPNVVKNLMDRNLPVIQPLVLSRLSPFGTVMLGAPDTTKLGYYHRVPLDNAHQSGVAEVNCVGAAGMLIRREVIDAIGDPWFETHAEDINFCEKARAKGFKIYADLDNRMGHLNVGWVEPAIKDGKWVTKLTFGDGEFYLPAVRRADGPHQDSTEDQRVHGKGRPVEP